MRRNDHEHDIQAAFFVWKRMHEDQYPELKYMFAVPNGGHRHVTVARYMKAEGQRAGVLDVQLPCPRGAYTGLWIEFKYGKNKLTPEQKEFAEKMVGWGHNVVVCYDWITATEIVKDYLALPTPRKVKEK